jgi:hypothetical protein
VLASKSVTENLPTSSALVVVLDVPPLGMPEPPPVAAPALPLPPAALLFDLLSEDEQAASSCPDAAANIATERILDRIANPVLTHASLQAKVRWQTEPAHRRN